MSEIVEVTNIKEYVDEILINEDSNFNQYYYRGEPRFYYKLMPSIARSTYILDERILINKAKKLYPNIFKNTLSPIGLLITLQHYGIPTRLLDITTNAFIALFFACKNPLDENIQGHEQELDGKVYIFHKIMNSEYDGIENILSRTYQIPTETIFLDDYLEFIKSYPDYNDMQSIMTMQIAQIMNSNSIDEYNSEVKRMLTHEIKEISDNPILINPPMLFDRIRLQAGNFMLFFNDMNKEQSNNRYLIESNIRELDKNHKYIKKIIRVKDDYKKEILNQLKLFNISESTLFYDNIDINCDLIKRSIRGE